MKRYEMTAEYNSVGCYDEVIPVESDNGDWIKFADYQAATEAAKATGTAGEQEQEAHKLARILWNMVEAVEDYQPNEIYREGYSSIDGDVFVHRAGNLLVEQAAEISELTRYVDAFGSKLAEAARQPAPDRQVIEGEFAIQVEKLLCKALGREWSATGISIESLVAALAATAAPVELSYLQLLAIADDSEAHEALKGFSEDPTQDNGVCVVRAILKAATNRSQP